MGLLKDLAGAAEVVAGVALIATGTPLGILGGALLETSFASQQGWLGGEAKNFFSSGVGADLTMAVGLASGAMAISGMVSDVAPVATAGGADVAATGAASGTMTATAEEANQAAGTAQAFTAANVTGANGLIQASQASLPPSYLAASPGEINS